MMTGTFSNSSAIATGSLIGVVIGSKLPVAMRETVLQGRVLVTCLIGLQLALPTQHVLVPPGALLMGGLLKIEAGLAIFLPALAIAPLFMVLIPLLKSLIIRLNG